MERAKIRTDLALAFGAQGLFKVGGYVILALLARHLARESFGQFLYLTALASLLVPLTELGTSNYLARETARAPRQTAANYVEVLLSRLPLVVLLVVGVVAFMRLTDPTLVWIAGAVAVFTALKELYRSSSSVLYGLRRVASAQLMYGAGLLLGMLLIVWATRGGMTLREVVLAYLAWTTFLFAGGVVLVRSHVGPLPWSKAAPRLRRLLRLSLPLFAVEVLALVHFKVDTVMLGLLRPMSEVATYEAGAKLLEASQFLVRPLTQIFFPILVTLAHEDRDLGRLRRLFPRILGLATVLGSGLALAVGLLAPWIIPVVFGSGFESSVPVLRILFLSVPALYVAVVATFTGNALHIERSTVLVLFGVVVLNLGLNALAIPRFGPIGAAWSTFASQMILAAVLMVVVRRAIAGASTREPRRPGVEAG